jgi:hypothetical protein
VGENEGPLLLPLIEQAVLEGPPLLRRVIGGTLPMVHGRSNEEGKANIGDALDEARVVVDNDALHKL